MSYVVTEKCVDCKFTSCVSVCPVDAFHELPDRLYINPETCIDCNACMDECPVEAILSDTEDGIEKWAEINRKYSEIWPNISEKKEPPADAENWQNIEDKFNKHFSEKPGR